MNRLLELRNERELSQREMAKHLNISQGTYNNWENSNTQPSIEQLIQLATFFEVSVDYLIGNSDSYEIVSTRPLKHEDALVLNTYNSLDKRTKEAVFQLMQNLAVKDKV